MALEQAPLASLPARWPHRMHLTCSCVVASSIACFNKQLDDVDGASFIARDALAEWLAGQQGSQEQAKVCGVQVITAA